MYVWCEYVCVQHTSVQFSLSVVSDSLQPHESQHARPPCPSPTPRFTQTHVHQVSDAIQPSHPLSSLSSPDPNPSQHQGLFQRVNSLREVAKVLEFQLQHQSFQWTPRADLLQNGLVGFPCSPRDSQESFPTPQFKSIDLQHSAVFTVQFSHPYMTTGKTIALTRQTFVGKVMPLLLNMLSRLVITLLPRSKCLNFMAAVTICSDFGAPKNKVWQFPLFPHLFPMKWWDQMPWSSFSECWANFFTLLFHFHQEGFEFLFTFCHKGGVICNILQLYWINIAIIIAKPTILWRS